MRTPHCMDWRRDYVAHPVNQLEAQPGHDNGGAEHVPLQCRKPLEMKCWWLQQKSPEGGSVVRRPFLLFCSLLWGLCFYWCGNIQVVAVIERLGRWIGWYQVDDEIPIRDAAGSEYHEEQIVTPGPLQN
ncbi:hypothetical protein P154DRAFT_294830 [Amniculicola lignicola CBS 123094]|uniref:Uncharacterized protein n=1 Tax=Amniculicola lignicola CBS 123094 TaxID=1392246 RepID=A0A6A5W5M0_9PLEO|nr:hypothetical protein P154DRAFT_294830 [Amniculicola lignicola CBS 123094]